MNPIWNAFKTLRVWLPLSIFMFFMTSTIKAQGSRMTDSLALVDLYNSTGGANWTNKWVLTQPMTTWYRVTLDANGRVIQLYTSNNGLNGTIPNLNLPKLQRLSLFLNQLSGNIPDFNLPELEELMLYQNQLSGTMPNFNLPKLKQLYLYNNQLTGSIPNFNLPLLEKIGIYNNLLTGNIPDFNLPSLQELSLFSNSLSGNIPNFNLPTLTSLNVSTNQLTGNIPNFNLPILRYFAASNNQLSGSIPPFNLPNLQNLFLLNNQLSGCIPREIKTNCISLMATFSNISGNLGLTTQNWANYWNNGEGACVPCASVTASISGNNIICGTRSTTLTAATNAILPTYLWSTGATTSSISVTAAATYGVTVTQSDGCTKTVSFTLAADNTCRCTDSLALIDLYNSTNGANWTNKWVLTQPMTTWYGVTLNGTGCVDIIDLDRGLGVDGRDRADGSGNNLNGSIPNLNIPSLRYLSLSGVTNKLIGPIPIFNLPNLIELYISRTSLLNGSIPNFNLPKLEILELYFNKLDGNMPNLNRINLPLLKRIYFYSNLLSGNIPNFDLPNLENLALDRNQFSGTIPIFNLPNLRGLYLYDNQLTGCIPAAIKTNCSLIGATNGKISGNTGLNTQSWENYWNNGEGACVTCTSATTPSVSTRSTTTCGTQNTTLSIASGTLNSATNWQWYSGSCGGTPVGSGASISVSPTATTTYYARGEGGSCPNSSCSNQVTITVNTPPTTPSFSATQPAVCLGETTTLTATGSLNSATDWYWYSGSCGGTPVGSGPSVTVSPSANTAYYLRAEGGNCPNSSCAFATIIFKNTPSANISGTLSFCSGSSTALTATGGGTYQWTGGSSANPLTVNSAGTYFVTVTGGNGCTATTSANVSETTTSAPPTTTVTYCQNAPAIPLSTTGSNLLWYANSTGGTGSTTVPTPSTTTAGTVNYYVSQTANSCESTRTAIPVTVTATPAAPTANTIAYCQNAVPASLIASGNSLLWYGTNATGGIGSSTATTPSTATIGTTNYYVSQTVNSCESPRKAVAVTVNALPLAPTASNIAYCQNEPASSLIATGSNLLWYGTNATGGVGNSTAPTPSTTTAGTTTYYVSQTVNSCESPRKAITITVNATPLAPTASNIAYCQNATAVSLVATGNSLLWYGTNSTGGVGNSTATIPSTTTAGTTTYYVSQTVNSCESPRKAIAVTVNAIPAAPTANNVAYCQNEVPASLAASGTGLLWYGTNATGGVGSSTATTPSTASVGTAIYYVSQTVNSCESPRKAITVTINPLPIMATPSVSNVKCRGNSDGTISVSASGGTNPIGFSINPLAGSQSLGNFTSLPMGTYTLTASDANGCKDTKTVSISQPTTVVSFSTPSVKPTKCNGSSDGEITLSASGGTGTINITTNPNITALPAGTYKNLTARTYTFTATDANNCTATTTATVTEPAVLNMASGTTTNILCNGSSTGQIPLTMSGGTPNYQIDYQKGSGAITSLPSSASATQTLTGLSAGTYNITVTDANGCKKVIATTLTEPATAVTATQTGITQVACQGAATGLVTLSATGGVAPYTYARSGTVSNTIGNFTGLSAGSFVVTITDANGCSSTKPVTITEPSALVASISLPKNVTCPNGADGGFQINANGGTPLAGNQYTYAYGLSTGGSTALGSAVSPKSTGNILAAGTYHVTVTDGNNCTVNTSLQTLTQPSVFAFSSNTITTTACSNATGTANFTVSGGSGVYTSIVLKNGSGTTVSTTGTGASRAATGLSAGNYSVDIVDDKNCTATLNFIVNSATSSVVLSTPSVIDVKCKGGNTGSISINATNAVNFAISSRAGQQTIGVFDNLTAGNYTVTAFDVNGCTAFKDTVVKEPTTAVTFSTSTISDVKCKNGNDGKVVLSASGGTGSLTYSMNAPIIGRQNANTFDSLTAATHSFTATDANGCMATTTAIVKEPNAALTFLTPSVKSVNCKGGKDGIVMVSANGGTLPITFSINPNQGIQRPLGTFDSLMMGSFTVTAKDNNNCTTTRMVTVSEPATSVVLADPSVINVKCNGGNTGQITASASGGTGSLQYETNPILTPNTGTFTGIFTGATARTYTVTARDTQGCKASKDVTITQPIPLTATVGTLTNVVCVGGSTGQIPLTINGGTPTYKIDYQRNSGTTMRLTGVSALTNLSAGMHSISVTDANNCTTAAVIPNQTITQPTPFLFNTVSKTDANCGVNNGAITFNVTGSSNNYTSTIVKLGAVVIQNYGSGTNTTQRTLTALAGGNYTVLLTDNNNCTDSLGFVIAATSSISIVSATPTGTTCFDRTDGKITVIASGGTGALSYSVDGTTFLANNVFSNLAANNYIVTVKDGDGCTAIKPVTVSKPPALIFSTPSVSNVKCRGGSDGIVVLSASGGTGSVSLTISPIIGLRSVDTFKNLTANMYVFTAKDASNCLVTQSLTVSQPNAALILANPILTNLKCFDGTDGQITASAAGGTGQIKYSISSTTINQQNTVGTFSNLTAQNYTITAVDSNGCSDSKPAIITSPNKLINSFTTNYTSICTQGSGNGKVKTAVIGGVMPYRYLWSNGLTTDSIANLAVGTYILTLTDNNNCTVIDSAKITCLPITYTLTLDADSTRCFGDSTGILRFTPSGNTQTATNGAPYTYIWQSVTNSNLRGTGRIATNGTTITIPNLPAGNYNVTINDSLNVLPKTAVIAIYAPPLLSIGNPTVLNPKCYGNQNGSLTLSPNGNYGGIKPYRFAWSNGATTPSILSLSAGTYRLTVVDGKGCRDSVEAVLKTDSINIGTKNITAAACKDIANGAITVSNITGGTITTGTYAFKWSNNAMVSTISNLAIGTYRLTITDSNGCQKLDSFKITPLRTLNISANATNVVCFGQKNGRISVTASAIGTANPPYTFTWTGIVGTPTNTSNSTIINGLSPNSYPLSIRDLDGCKLDTAFTIRQPDSIKIVLDNLKKETCSVGNDGQISITATGGTLPLQYKWSRSAQDIQPTLSNLKQGNYTLTVTDAAQCVKNQAFTIGLTVDNLQKPIVTVQDSTINSLTFSWLPVPNAGRYEVKIKDSTWIAPNGNLQHIVSNLGVLETIDFKVRAISNNSFCTPSVFGQIKGKTKDKSLEDICFEELKKNIPDVFSPNDDGINELFDPEKYFIPSGCPFSLRAEQLIIVSRWGEVIYQAKPYQAWDGKSNNYKKPVMPSAYYYVLVFKIDGKERLIKGVINCFSR